MPIRENGDGAENRVERGDECRPVRVLLADDHTMFREGLAMVLASFGGVEVVGGVPTDDAPEAAREAQPDVVASEVRLPLEGAKEALGRMLALPRPPKVVFCSVFEDPRYARELTGLGANAYLVKSAPADLLVAAVRAAVSNPKGEHVLVGLPRSTPEEAREVEGGVLSSRELEVLVLAAKGLSNRQISRALHLSESTVKRHLGNIYPKMGVASRGEAASKALAENLITAEDVTG